MPVLPDWLTGIHKHLRYRNTPPWVAGVQKSLATIITNQGKIMATLDQILQDVTDEGTRLDSLSTFISGLKQQLADALSGTTLPTAVQAKVDAIFAGAEANKGKIDVALNANTPPPAPVSTPSTTG